MTKTIIALFLFVSTITLAQEKVLLRYNYEKGDSYTIDVKITSNVGAANSTFSFIINKTIKSNTNNEYICESQIKKIAIKSELMGFVVSYDTSKKDEEINDEDIKQLKTSIDPLLELITTTKETHLGKILESKTEPNISGGSDTANQHTDTVYPEKALSINDTWVGAGNNKEIQAAYIYKVISITSNTVIVGIKAEMKGEVKSSGTGKMVIDKKTGIVLEFQLDMNMKVQDQKVKQSSYFTTVKN